MTNHPNRSRMDRYVAQGAGPAITNGPGPQQAESSCAGNSHDWLILSDDGTVRRAECKRCSTTASWDYRSTSGL